MIYTTDDISEACAERYAAGLPANALTIHPDAITLTT